MHGGCKMPTLKSLQLKHNTVWNKTESNNNWLSMWLKPENKHENKMYGSNLWDCQLHHWQRNTCLLDLHLMAKTQVRCIKTVKYSSRRMKTQKATTWTLKPTKHLYNKNRGQNKIYFGLGRKLWRCHPPDPQLGSWIWWLELAFERVVVLESESSNVC